MANNKDFIVKNAVEVGGATKVTVGDAATGGSRVSGFANVSTWAYDSVSFSVSSQDSQPHGIIFNNDGSKMYMVGETNDNAHQYSLSTAFDLSTASYDSVSFSFSSQDTAPYDIAFNNDGSKMYMSGTSSSSLYQYSLSTAYNLSTASYDSVSFSVSSQDTFPRDIAFNNDGTKMYMIGTSNNNVHQYSLSTAFNLGTASYDSVSLSVSSQEGGPTSITFSNDGSKLYVAGLISDSVHQYTLSTAFDLSTASYDSVSFSVTSEDGVPTSITFNDDGSKMYMVGGSTDTVYQYSTGSTVTTGSFDLSTGNYFTDTPSADVEYTFSNAGDVQSFQLEVTGAVKGYELSGAAYDSVSFSVSSQDTQPASIAFNSDGTKMYMIGYVSDSVHQYSLSTAYDISTASYDSVSFSVSGQEGLPFGIAFNNNGTKMYIVGFSSDAIYQYSLSTAYDLSTASYDSVSLDVSSQDGSPHDIGFNLNGTKIYMMGSDSDKVHQYTLSTAYDLNTATYDSISLNVTSQDTTPRSFKFNPDGTKLFMLGSSTNTIYQYSLSTAFDVSTGSYDSVSFSVNSQDTLPFGLAFNGDGSKMYMIGSTNDTIYQYTTGTAITVTWDADIAWPSGTAPDSPAAGEKDIYTFTTDDGGTTYIGVQSGDAFS